LDKNNPGKEKTQQKSSFSQIHAPNDNIALHGVQISIHHLQNTRWCRVLLVSVEDVALSST